jgi:hypothetical protein
MRRYGLRAGLGLGFLLLGGAMTLIAAPPPVVDLPREDGRAGAIAAPPDARNESPTQSQAAEPVRPGNPMWAIPIKDLTVTRERPIFSASRRPPPPVVAAAPYVPPPPVAKPAGPQRPQLALIGTVVNAKEGFGIFLDQATNTVMRLKTGEGHDGWILRSVQGREATLEKDRETAVLALPARDTEQTGIPSMAPALEPARTPAPKLHHNPDD